LLRALLFSFVSAATLSLSAPQPKTFHYPLVFEPNRGQAPEQVKWIARGPGYELFLTRDGLTMTIREETGAFSKTDMHSAALRAPESSASSSMKYSTVHMKLANSLPWDDVTALNPTGGFSNYFRGVGDKGTIGSIPQYARLKVSGVYKNIDLVLYSHDGDLEYDFVLAAGADPKQIHLKFEGQDHLRLDNKSGDLVLATTNGTELRQVRPRVYQQAQGRRDELVGGYRLLQNGQAAFTVAHYDLRRPLVIDPTVTLVRFVGGSAGDSASAVAVDSAGNSYITGSTFSENFPVAGALQPSLNCKSSASNTCLTGTDAFVTKLSPTGAIIFSTFLGGNDYDSGTGIALDSTGVYIIGNTSSSDFPNKLPDGTADTRLGGQDAFLTKLSLDGSQLLFSRIMSGSGSDTLKGIALDSQHSVWVTGLTTSGTFLVGTPANNFLAQVQGPSDIFYRKIGSAGDWLFSGLLGGSGDDIGAAVAIDPDDNPWFTGETCSPDFPATPGYNYLKGRCGVFVARLTDQPEIGTIKSAMVFGGSDIGDSGTGIVVNSNREAYITGVTHTSLFPVTSNAYQTVPIWSAVAQAFVMKLDGLHWIYSTFLGGNDGDTIGNAIALNAEGEVYVGADTSSTFFRTQPTPQQPIGVLCKFSADLSTLLSMTFLGDSVHGIAVLEGPPTVSGPLIYTAESFSNINTNSLDAVMERVADEFPTTTTLISAPNPSVANTNVTLEASVNSAIGLPQGGQVLFLSDGAATIGLATLSNGNAKISVPLHAFGSYHFRAKYLTDGKFASSISNIVTHTVAHPTSLTLTSSVNPSSANQPVTFTAKITTDTGSVSGNILLFRKNGPRMSPSIIGSGALSGNMGRITISNLFVGDNVITAVFEGNPDYVPSQSASLTQTVKPASTATTLTSSRNPSSAGQTVKFTAKVVPAFGGTPSGTVTFKNGTTTLGKATLSGGRATFNTSKISSGQRSISANYSGDAQDAPSSKTITQTVR
jgi:hypothetical protein